MAGIIDNYTEVGCPKGILLGDPTLKYTTTVNNIIPCITTNLAGEKDEPRLILYSGVPFTMQATDPDLTTNGRNDSIVIELSGNDPASIAMLQTANITNGTSSLTWK
ncbi:MAG TPA: hypothetical protein VIO64_01195 [Pseudobacteroides sp.]|uniref:hypothetical protein n=1 Tax=Pseudobacteroides sp. TaxID=1968840 RepID=UPI002F91D0A7